ncbi:hypothetical protein SFUMM280S_05025 [Streptomyces fumanus]
MGLGSLRRDGLPAVGWVGMERAAGTVGTGEMPPPTFTGRVPGSGVRSGSAGVAWAAAARRAP